MCINKERKKNYCLLTCYGFIYLLGKIILRRGTENEIFYTAVDMSYYIPKEFSLKYGKYFQQN